MGYLTSVDRFQHGVLIEAGAVSSAACRREEAFIFCRPCLPASGSVTAMEANIGNNFLGNLATIGARDVQGQQDPSAIPDPGS
jgi:hypothetical protein